MNPACCCLQAAHEQSVVPEPEAAAAVAPEKSAVPAAADAPLNATAAKPARRGLFTLHGRRFPRDFKGEIAFAILAVSQLAASANGRCPLRINAVLCACTF